MNYGSVCSGAGTCAMAFLPLGVKAAWFCEISPAPSAVLAHHWPEVPNLGDMTTLPARILAREVEAPDILMGGTPCQAFSVAGTRRSLDDIRGNLTLTFVEIANAIDAVRSADGHPPVIILWENVPGVLSVEDNDFGCFLGALAGSGAAIQPINGRWTYAGMVSGPSRSIAWRTMDAQYQRVAQRRRRVFVVAGAGKFRPDEVLFESEGVRRDSPPSRGAGEVVAGTVAGGARQRGGRSDDDRPIISEPCTFDWQDGDGGGDDSFQGKSRSYICDKPGRSRSLSANKVPAVFGGNDIPHVCGKLQVNGKAAGSATNQDAESGQLVVAADVYNGEVTGDIACTIPTKGSQCAQGPHVIAFPAEMSGTACSSAGDVCIALSTKHTAAIYFDVKQITSKTNRTRAEPGLPASTLNAHAGMHVATTAAVRRLTPRECERLQGWPDDHTLVQYRGKPMQDGPRYKIIGNGWALPCVRWIGRRIVKECK